MLRGRGGQAAEALDYRVVIPDLWRVSDALVWIRRVLVESGGEGRGLGDFLPPLRQEDLDYELKVRAAVASTFLAGLELAREDLVELHQNVAFEAVRFAAMLKAAG